MGALLHTLRDHQPLPAGLPHICPLPAGSLGNGIAKAVALAHYRAEARSAEARSAEALAARVTAIRNARKLLDGAVVALEDGGTARCDELLADAAEWLRRVLP